MAIQYINSLKQDPKAGAHLGMGRFKITDEQQLQRFLILGTEGGTYYATEHELTVDNAECVKRLVQNDKTGLKAVETIVAVSDAGRAPKNDPALLALAVAVKFGTPVVRAAALAALPKVARIGTHLFHFAGYCKALGVGWGRAVRTAFARWYTARGEYSLAKQLVKYQSRDGWSHRDILRLAHVTPLNLEQQALFHWVVKGEGPGTTWEKGSAVEHVWAFEQAKKATNVQQLVQLIVDYKLPREAIPTEFLNSPEVWATLLVEMKPEALVRNLAKMTQVGLLKPLSAETLTVCNRLRDPAELKAARVHPLKMLSALMTYKRGHGVRGSLSWTPVPQIVGALEQGFHAAFGTIEPTNKRVMECLDVSGSMTMGEIAGVPGLSPRVASACMAMVSAKTEQQVTFVAFTNTLVPFPVHAGSSLDHVIRTADGMAFGATDCSAPMEYAIRHNIQVDAFRVYTDSETNCNRRPPARALADYRQRTGIDAKLIVVGMTASDVSIADPNDPGMLDVVGFDTAAPNLMSDFIKG